MSRVPTPEEFFSPSSVAPLIKKYEKLSTIKCGYVCFYDEELHFINRYVPREGASPKRQIIAQCCLVPNYRHIIHPDIMISCLAAIEYMIVINHYGTFLIKPSSLLQKEYKRAPKTVEEKIKSITASMILKKYKPNSIIKKIVAIGFIISHIPNAFYKKFGNEYVLPDPSLYQ